MTLALLLIACSGGLKEPEETSEEVIQAMEAHWDDAETMRDAAVMGDAEAYRKAATSLHDRLPTNGVPEELSAMQDALKAAALEARNAKGTEQMGKTFGDVVALCGSCHEAAGVTPQLDPIPPPPTKDGEPTLEMLWHQLAALDLWVAVLRHDAEGWEKGIGKVEKATFATDDGTAAGAQQTAIEARMQALASQSHGAADTPARAEAFGRLIGMCAECHTASPPPTGEGDKPAGDKKKKGKKGKKSKKK